VTAPHMAWLPAILSALMVMSGCSSDAPDAERQPPEQRQVPSPATPAQRPEIEPSAIEQYAREHFPEHYAGVAVEPDGTIAVYRVPSRAFDQSLQREFGTDQINLRDARYSERSLQQLTDQILDESAYWTAQGVDIQGAGPDFVRGVVEVITPDAETARPLFANRYHDRVVVREGAVAPATR
jgi:hypothetical protein